MGLINIWIDCDPGIDDAVMLAVAAASRDKLKIHGISTVAGNQTSDHVTGNAVRLAAAFGMGDVPVFRGAARPLVRDVTAMPSVHGDNGLGGVELPETDKRCEDGSGVAAMRDAIMGLPAGETMTLVATGPLTNIGLLLATFPEVRERLSRIVVMGGTTIGGSVTPVSEFNTWTDPEAAAIVYRDSVPVVMCGLDVTHQCGLTAAQIAELTESDSELQRAFGQMLRFYFASPSDREGDITVIHDVVTILFLTNPELFSGEVARIAVDCSDGLTRGQTMRDLRSDAVRSARGGAFDGAPVFMLTGADSAGFQRVFLEKLKTY